MGVVYSAWDLQLQREVAIKTLMRSANSDRFLREARLTAQLPHPAIPPVYALGTFEDGRPYLAMKLIRGRTLAELLSHPCESRVELQRYVLIFEQSAQAVGFAHRQGVIHRDLKPSNIMIGEFGEVQVMDWGLAKAQEGTAGLNMTLEEADSLALPSQLPDARPTLPEAASAGKLLGTPGYMAPEQARCEPVDARSDVFSLGSILTEILTGKPAITGGSVVEVIRKTESADVGDALARLDGSGADRMLVDLARQCLQARREDRPADGNEVAARIEAYRASVEQRLRQAEEERTKALVRTAEARKRNRLALAAGVVVGLVLLAGTVGTAIGYYRARVAAEQAMEDRAAAVLAAQMEKRAMDESANRLSQIERISDSMFDIFSSIDIRDVKRGTEPLEKLLSEGLIQVGKRLDEKSLKDPMLRAKLAQRLGHSLFNLGYYKEAEELLQSARRQRFESLGAENEETLSATNDLASCWLALGRFQQALPLLEETLRLRRQRLGPKHSDTLVSMNNLAMCHISLGHPDRALPLLEERLQAVREIEGENKRETPKAMNNLAGVFRELGRTDEALALQEESVRLYRQVLGTDHPDTLQAMNNLAEVYRLKPGRLAEAIKLHEETLGMRKTKLGIDHPETLQSMNNLAGNYSLAGRMASAIPLWEETLAARRKKLGSDHPATLATLNNLANAYATTENHEQAARSYDELLASCTAKLGPNHPKTLLSMSNKGRFLESIGKLGDALPLHECAARGMEQRGFQHEYAEQILRKTIAAYEQAMQPERAESWRRKWEERAKHQPGSHPEM